MRSLFKRIPQMPRWLWLVPIGCVSEGVYFFYFARSFPLSEYYSVPLLDLGKITRYSHEAAYAFVMAFTGLFVLYYAAYRIARQVKVASIQVVMLFGALFSATLVQVYPVGAADVFDYIASARILAVYHQNPFIRVAADFPGDPFLPFVAWKGAPVAYGPIWAWLSAAVTYVAGDGLFANLIAFKLLAIAFYLASAWMVYRILKRMAPHLQMAGTILFAWNPLVVYEVSVNAHNDVLMVFLLLVAIYLLQRDQKKLSVGFVALSYLLKYVTAVLLPVFVLAGMRRVRGSWARLAFFVSSMFIALGASALLYLPFWSGLDTVSISRRETMFTASFPTIALIALEPRMDTETAQLVISRVAAIILVVFVLIQAWRSGPRTSDAVNVSFQVLFFYLLFVCLWFQPWYLIWLVALAALLAPMDIAHRTMLFCYTAIMSYFVFVFHWIWNAEYLDWRTIQQHAVVVVYTLPIAYTVYGLIRTRLARQMMDSHDA